MAGKIKTVAMCCVTIGHQKLLLPADAGMKVVALLQNARDLAYDFDAPRPMGYIVGESVDVEFVTVRPNQLRAPPERPEPTPSRQPRIGRDTLLLGHDD